MILVLVDTQGIQRYIFRSNVLTENAGASELVAQATGEWVRDALPAPNNLVAGGLDVTRRIEDNAEMRAELIYAAGGNALILFRHESGAQSFTSALSRKALEDAPGLNLVIAGAPTSWDESLGSAVEAVSRDAARKKREAAASWPVLGLGVTASCSTTRLPATGIVRDPDGVERPASPEVIAKHAAVDASRQRLNRLGVTGFHFPRLMEELGGTRGDTSYVGVVHVDGNDMGARFRGLADTFDFPGENRPYLERVREFSDRLNEASAGATRSLVERLGSLAEGGSIAFPPHLLEADEDGRPRQAPVPPITLITRKDGSRCLPFRPIVYGGDDVTFLCDARLALWAAIHYTTAFEKATGGLPDGKGEATVCGGVAMVKTRYPFARAYAFSEELCQKAKVERRTSDSDGSWLDWHLAQSGLYGTIDDIRDREYWATSGRLFQRPVSLRSGTAEDLRTWDAVRAGIRAFQSGHWAGRRSKAKALRDALREGPEAVRRFIKLFGIGSLPDLRGYPQISQSGWHGKQCAYFDALELLDIYMPLDEAEGPPAGGSQRALAEGVV